LGHGGKLGLLVAVDDGGVGELVTQSLALLAEQLGLILESAHLLLLFGALGGACDGVGLAIEDLAAGSALLGEAGDGAVKAEEDGIDAGEALLGL
jgi:hypothetical protein